MGRTKQFDKQAALDGAMQLFWAKGFHGTSMQDLVDNLGVNRQSLYDTFGGKHELFEAALERYRELQALPMRRLLEKEGSVAEILRSFFQEMVSGMLNTEGKGCLMVNSTTELASQDEAVFGTCSANARQLEAAFTGLIVRAQQSGEIPEDRSPVQLARFLLSTMNGLAVTAKATRDRKVLNDVVEVALSALGL
ncbi:MAG: TetR/AcrR family transcriptional regulator [Betaproteobacteria bacterium]|nr:MAG: TetR/AcrR family transcriptional regulator [Betaproteobacteria bacterium]